MMPGLGRFLSVNSVQPNAPGTQGFNVYAYAANNPTTWADPSGHSVLPQLLLSMNGVGSGLQGLAQALTRVFFYVACVLDGDCLEELENFQNLVSGLGSAIAETYEWSIETLRDAQYMWPLLPQLPTVMGYAASIGIGFVPFWGDLYDLYTAITGYDPLTGQYLEPWERWVGSWCGAHPLPL